MSERRIRRLVIANRGEIALRVQRACRELGIETIQVYSEADRASLAVQRADHAVCIGPARSSESYLRADTIVHVAKAFGADAIHPGYGFLSENAAFAALCEESGVAFVGPPAKVIALMGDKACGTGDGRRGRRAGDPGLERRPRRCGRRCPHRGLARLSGDPEGGRGRRRARHAGGRARGRPRRPLRGGLARGEGGVRRRHDVRREVPHRRCATSRSRCSADAGDVLHLGERECSVAAPPPEAGRGEPFARPAGGDCARAWARPRCACAARRLPQRRNDRVPRRPGERRLLLHGDEHARAGRASGHRDASPASTSSRSRSASPRASACRCAQDDVRLRRPRHRVPHQRRGPGARLRAAPRRS